MPELEFYLFKSPYMTSSQLDWAVTRFVKTRRPSSFILTHPFSVTPSVDWMFLRPEGKGQGIMVSDFPLPWKMEAPTLLRSPKSMKGVHRRNLPPPPTRHKDLDMHPLGQLFEQAETDHFQSHIPMNSWTKIDCLDAQGSKCWTACGFTSTNLTNMAVC